jgi:lysophospholipid acyltransferase (LPLAT)-like uncharacterized protein
MRDQHAMLKRLLKTDFARSLAAWLLALYMAGVRRTTRWERIGAEHVEPLWRSGRGLVWCYWHSRIMGAHATWPTDVQPCTMLTSPSRDGDITTAAIRLIKRGAIRGSATSKGRAKGSIGDFKALIRVAREGGCVGLTPDGPKGPRLVLKEGPVRIAKAAGAPIVVSAWSIAGSRVLKSWDRTVLPPLFGRGVIVFGPVIEVGEDLEATRIAVEAALNAVTWEADDRMGLARVLPEAGAA